MCCVFFFLLSSPEPPALFAAAAEDGGGELTACWGAQACDRDGEGNCPTYERAALLLAYEIVWLINGLQSSLRFRQRKGFDMNHHWPLVAFVCPGFFFLFFSFF